MTTALPEDSWLHDLRPQPARVTAAEYEALSEDLARAIEIVDGYVVFCEAPPRTTRPPAGGWPTSWSDTPETR